METIYNTETVNESAYLLTSYEKDGVIDIEQYAIDEVITPVIEKMTDDELIGLYNEFASETYNDEFYENDYFTMKELFSTDPMAAVRATQYGNYNYMEDYIKFNSYGNIDSYNAYSARRECMECDEFFSWIYEEYYIDEEEDERESAALELVKAGY